MRTQKKLKALGALVRLGPKYNMTVRIYIRCLFPVRNAEV